MSGAESVTDIVAHWARVRPELDVSAMEVFGRLHRAFLLYRSRINDLFEQHGINEAGFDVMACLRRAPDFRRTAGELAAQTLVTTGGLTLRVNRLDEAGLVSRERDAEDARVVHVTLTEAGRALIDEVADLHFANETQMLAGMSPHARIQLADLLEQLEQSLRSSTSDDAVTTEVSA